MSDLSSIGNIELFKKLPFIKRFKSDDNYYIYDVNTNRILRVSPTVYKIVPHIWTYKEDRIRDIFKNDFINKDIDECFNLIKNLLHEYRVFSPCKPKFRGSRTIIGGDQLRQYFEKKNIEQMCLEVTQQCNLRCKYCIHSGKYKYQRMHNSKIMEISIAEKAVDFFIKRINENKWNISFYGGEPLLRVDFIKKCIDYINSFGLKSDHNYRIVTNGTLLDEIDIDYLIKNSIDLQISLDGPAKHHDRYRLYRNGKGSFRKVIQCIEKIREHNETYFRSHVMFMCIVTPTTNILELNDYFLSDDLAKDAVFAKLGPLDIRENSFFRECSVNKNQAEEISSLWKTFREKTILNDEGRHTILDPMFINEFTVILKRDIRGEPQEWVPINGPCMPGLRRLFVSSDGLFHICEKMNPNYPIGDAEHGFDYKKIGEIWEDFIKISNDEMCLNCWAVNMCDLCFVHVSGEGPFKLHNKKQFCELKKKNLISTMEKMAYIWEKNPAKLAEWIKRGSEHKEGRN